MLYLDHLDHIEGLKLIEAKKRKQVAPALVPVDQGMTKVPLCHGWLVHMPRGT